MVVWELVSIGRGTTYLVSGKPRLTLPYDLRAQVMPQKWGATKIHMAPRNCSRLSVFSEFLAESGSVSNVLYVTVSCPGPAAHMPCFLGNSSAIFSSEQGIHITWVFEQICCFPSVAQSCPTLCDPMDCSTPGFPVHHHLPELAQTHVHWVSDAIQPSHPLPSPSPPAFNQSFPASGSYPVNQFFVSGGHIVGASASALAFPMNIQGWLPFGLTGLTRLPVMNIKMWNTFQLFAGGELCAFLTGMC